MRFVYVVIITDHDLVSEASTRLEEITEEAYDRGNFIMAPNERVLLFRTDPDEAITALELHQRESSSSTSAESRTGERAATLSN